MAKRTDDHKDLQCLLLKKQIQWEEIQKAAVTLQEKCPIMTINEDMAASLQEFLKGVIT